jgi:hypothetical protein
MAEADPQASVLARITGLEVDKVQTALTIFVALLIEIGSAFGMYVAFAYWRINDRAVEKTYAPEATVAPVAAPLAGVAQAVDVASVTPAVAEVAEAPAAEPLAATDEEQAAVAPPARRLNANDNRLPRGVPDSDVQRFYRERVVAASEGSSLTSTELYEEYCRWCEDNEKEPFAHPRVTREIGELGVKKERIGKRTRYFGIALRSEARRQEDKKHPAPIPRAA